jgi:hypothetical protein
VSCRRAYEIDIAAYLADPRAAEFADFRAHYPACVHCAAELRAWTELAARLHAGRAHPEPELLLRYEDAPDRLDLAARGALRDHLTGCASCREELAGLRTFAHAAGRGQARAPVREGRGFAAALRGLLWQPAFAYAVAFALAAPLIYLQIRGDRLDLRGAPRPEPTASTQEPVEKKAKSPSGAGAPLERAPAAEPRPMPAPQPAPAAPPETKPRAAPKPELERSRKADEPGLTARVEPAPRVEPAATRSELEQLRSLGYVEPSREGASAAAAGGPPRLALRTDAGGVDTLSVPLDAEGGASEVRVESPSRDRHLTQRYPAGTQSAELRLPPGWLGAGRYRVVVKDTNGEREYTVER